MTLEIEHYRNKIVDYLFVPRVFNEKSDSELDNGIFENIEQSIHFLKEDCEKYYLWGYHYSLLHHIYFDVLRNGKDPKTLEQFFEIVELLPLQDIERIMYTTLLDTTIQNNEVSTLPEVKVQDVTKEKMFELLENSSKSSSNKWFWSMAIRHPKDTVQKMINISRQVSKIYDPFYKIFEQSVRDYAKQFTLDIFESFPTTKGLLSFIQSHEERIYTFILSKWQVALAYTESDILIASVDIEQELYKNQSIDNEKFTDVLKVLGDDTRYQILQEVIKPNMKVKQVAELLNITSAAVSFHTQKMINKQLLMIDIENNDLKYRVNKNLLKDIIDKLQSDFNIQ